MKLIILHYVFSVGYGLGAYLLGRWRVLDAAGKPVSIEAPKPQGIVSITRRDLLEALKAALQTAESIRIPGSSWTHITSRKLLIGLMRDLRTAIAKAEGRS